MCIREPQIPNNVCTVFREHWVVQHIAEEICHHGGQVIFSVVEKIIEHKMEVKFAIFVGGDTRGVKNKKIFFIRLGNLENKATLGTRKITGAQCAGKKKKREKRRKRKKKKRKKKDRYVREQHHEIGIETYMF